VRRARAIAAIAAALVPCGCGDERPPAAHATALPRAALVLEPPRIGVGEVSLLEIAVAAPPGHLLRPLALPEPPAGLEVLGVETLPVEREATRWLHRTRVRVRARETGALTWPGSAAEIEAPDHSLSSIALEPVAIEVIPIAPEFPERSLPFGVREPPRGEAGGGGALTGAVLGAAIAVAGIGVTRALARRRLRRGVPAAPPAAEPAPEPPWGEALAQLTRARALAGDGPFGASDLAARALRRYAGRRFAIGAQACTSEELAASPAPFAATTRWPILIAALQELDAHRFRPRDDLPARATLARALPDAIAAAERFVAETLPVGSAR
jgi:hypothetical protein